LINVTYDSDMNPDFSDLRFTNGSENTELDYWIADKVDSSYANVWVEIDQPITTTNTTVAYMYFDNDTSVNTKSSIFNTFIFGDDFEDLDVSDYREGFASGNGTACTLNAVTNGTYNVVNVTPPSTNGECVWYHTNGSVPTDRIYILESDFLTSDLFQAVDYAAPKIGSADNWNSWWWISPEVTSDDIMFASLTSGSYDGASEITASSKTDR